MKRRIDVFDTTLRDGEQAAGSRLDIREKIEIARQLSRLGVDIIEAGFPNSSPKDFEAVRTLANEIEGPVICGLSRAVATDIDACGRALSGARRSRIHTGIGASDIHIMGKFAHSKYGGSMAAKRSRIMRMATDAVRQARSYTDDVEFYAEDSGRADRGYLFEMIAAVIEAGAGVVNIPDTTGFAVPGEYGALIADIARHVDNIDRARISVHCHDDLGMAVANTLAGIQNGATQIEGTINGIGERAGNASIEEVVMALQIRSDAYGVDTGIDARECYRTSRMVSEAYDMPVPANKAVVGENAFAHSSGIHVDGVLKRRDTYEIMKPEDVGFPDSRVVLTARTGRHGLRHRLGQMGHHLDGERLEQAYRRFLEVADCKREVSDEDLISVLRG